MLCGVMSSTHHVYFVYTGAEVAGAGKIFMLLPKKKCEASCKTTENLPHEIFPLYGNRNATPASRMSSSSMTDSVKEVQLCIHRCVGGEQKKSAGRKQEQQSNEMDSLKVDSQKTINHHN